MTTVQVRLHGFGRSPGRGEEQRVALPSPATVTTLVERLAGQLGPASAPSQSPIVNAQRLLIIVNGRQIHHLQGLDTPLEEGDVVAIMPPVLGG
jgi:molybdopterin synthase sulfur carrier subunit